MWHLLIYFCILVSFGWIPQFIYFSIKLMMYSLMHSCIYSWIISHCTPPSSIYLHKHMMYFIFIFLYTFSTTVIFYITSLYICIFYIWFLRFSLLVLFILLRLLCENLQPAIKLFLILILKMLYLSLKKWLYVMTTHWTLK